MKSANYVLFPGISWWLLLLIPFIFFGFQPTYFSGAFFRVEALLHFHAIFLSAWVVLVVIQPVLILKKKRMLHRWLGKLSYILMPLVLISTWLMVRRTYALLIQGPEGFSLFEKESMYIPIIYFMWLAVFYTLAIYYRKRVVLHATYMFAAILTLLGPSLDRILFQIYQYYHIGFNVFAEYAVFVLIDVVLLALLYYQWQKGYSLTAVSFSLLIYLAGQAGYIILPHTSFWEPFLARCIAT